MINTYRLWKPLVSGYFSPLQKPEAQVTYLCNLLDIDFNIHLNASVYSILCDAGRRNLVKNLGLVPLMVKERWMPIVVDARFRFHKEIPLWRVFTVTTKLLRIYEKSYIVESRFVSGTTLHCVAIELGFFLQNGRRIRSERLLSLLPAELVEQLPKLIERDVKTLEDYLLEQLAPEEHARRLAEKTKTTG